MAMLCCTSRACNDLESNSVLPGDRSLTEYILEETMMQAVRTTIRICLGSLIAVTAMAHGTSTAHAGPANVPLRLNPNNPRYFEFRGKPAVLITSGEHYGAVSRVH